MGEQGQGEVAAAGAKAGIKAGTKAGTEAGAGSAAEGGAKSGADAAGRAKLVFGDPLDRQSADDSDGGWGERPTAGESGGRGLDWYLSQRPPHHGG